MAHDADPTVAGYPLHDDGSPFPGGRSFPTTHPVHGRAVLRRYRGEWLAPADSIDGFLNRLQSTLKIEHPNLAKVFDAGFVGSDVFAVIEAFDGESLEVLVKDIGPMPTFLACDFVRQAALALQAAHDRGAIHGDVRPAHLFVGPLIASTKTRPDGTPILRPGSDANAKLFDLGLIPVRPSGREWAGLDPLSAKPLGFLPPERVDVGTTTTATDIYGLGATLFFLLTGRAPYVANSAADVVNAIANTPPAPLATLRPDLPVGLVDLVNRMIAKNPAERPASAAIVAEALAPFAEPEPVPLTPAPPEKTSESGNLSAWTVTEYTGPDDTESMVAPAAGEHLDAFASAHSEAAAAPRDERKKSKMTNAERTRLKIWLWVGGVFWLVAGLLWIVLLSDSGCFKSNGGKADKQQNKRK